MNRNKKHRLSDWDSYPLVDTYAISLKLAETKEKLLFDIYMKHFYTILQSKLTYDTLNYVEIPIQYVTALLKYTKIRNTDVVTVDGDMSSVDLILTTYTVKCIEKYYKKIVQIEIKNENSKIKKRRYI